MLPVDKDGVPLAAVCASPPPRRKSVRPKRLALLAVAAAACLACGDSTGTSASDPRSGGSEDDSLVVDLPRAPRNSYEGETPPQDESAGYRHGGAPGPVDYESLHEPESRSARHTASSVTRSASTATASTSMGRRSGSSKRRGRRRRSQEKVWRGRLFSVLDGQRMEQISEYKEVLLLSMLVLVLAIRAIHLEVSFRLKPDKLAEGAQELDRRTEAYELNKAEVADGRSHVEGMMQRLVRKEAELASRKEELNFGEAALEGERLAALQRAQVKAERQRFVEELEGMREEFEEELQEDFKIILNTLKRHLLYLTKRERELKIDPETAGRTPLPEPPAVQVLPIEELMMSLDSREKAYQIIRKEEGVQWADVKRAKEEMLEAAVHAHKELFSIFKAAQRKLWKMDVEKKYLEDPEVISSEVKRMLEYNWVVYDYDQQQFNQRIDAQRDTLQKLREELEAIRAKGDEEKTAIAELAILDAKAALEIWEDQLDVPLKTMEDFLREGTEAAEDAIVHVRERSRQWKSRRALETEVKTNARSWADHVAFLQSLIERTREAVKFNSEALDPKRDPLLL